MRKLGQRIRKKRENMEIRLNELAEKVGISPSALSQIENMKVMPSIVHLKSIAEILNTSVGELIGENEFNFQDTLIKSKEKKFLRSNSNNAQLFLLSHNEKKQVMETYMIRFNRGSNSEGFFIERPGQEFCHVLKGEVLMEIEDKKYILQPGDSIYFYSNKRHFIKNMKRTSADVLWIVAADMD